MSEASTVQHGQQKRKAHPSLSTSNQETDDKRQAVRLDWRIDPEESYSDWKIEISMDDKTQETYYVHRNILSVGSQYFARLFANTTLKEHETHTSRIEMEELALKAFPLMLDYLYFLWDNGEKPITTKNSVVLHHFGCYFEILGLRQEVQAFCSKGMTVDQAGTYLEQANFFHGEQVRDLVAEECVSLIRSITVDSTLMEISDTKFWLVVLDKSMNEPNPDLSTLVSSFCSKHKETVDADTFLKLTDETTLPKLSVTAAMQLLQLEKLFVTASPSVSELSSLQARGFDALTSCGPSSPFVLSGMEHHFEGLPPNILPKLLQQSLRKLWSCNNKLEGMMGCIQRIKSCQGPVVLTLSTVRILERATFKREYPATSWTDIGISVLPNLCYVPECSKRQQ